MKKKEESILFLNFIYFYAKKKKELKEFQKFYCVFSELPAIVVT